MKNKNEQALFYRVLLIFKKEETIMTRTITINEVNFSESMAAFFYQQVCSRTIMEREELLRQLVSELSDFAKSKDESQLFAGSEHLQIGYVKCLMHTLPTTVV